LAVLRPTLNDVLSHYPLSGNDFGAGGRIIDNPIYEHTCALRLSTALETASPGIMGSYNRNRAVHLAGSPGHYRRITFPFARGAYALARYLTEAHVGWQYRTLNSRHDAMGVSTQGIIFWKVKPSSGSPNHIDLWDPSARTLRTVGGRTMLWAPAAAHVEWAWFWSLARGAQMSPSSRPHSIQSGR
jgi:hypothetical protein